MEVGLIRS